MRKRISIEMWIVSALNLSSRMGKKIRCKHMLQLAFLAFCPALLGQQAMNNDSVLKLANAGLSDDLIVTTINSSPGTYDTSANGIIALKQGGANDKIISAILTK